MLSNSEVQPKFTLFKRLTGEGGEASGLQSRAERDKQGSSREDGKSQLKKGEDIKEEEKNTIVIGLTILITSCRLHPL